MHAHLRVQLVTLLLLFFSTLTAEAKPKIHLGTDREIFIEYTSKSWNIDSTVVDSAFLIFRDDNTGRMVQIQLEETEPDSSKFVGQFSITWTDANHVSPQIYIPAPDLRKKTQKQILEMVSNGKIGRKPIIVKKNEQDQTVIEVFDEKPAAEEAWKDYQQELKKRGRELIKPVPSEENLQVAAQVEHEKMMKDFAKQAAERETERSQILTTEQEHHKTALEKFNKLSPEEQQTLKDKAKAAYDEGMKIYAAGDFAGSEPKFHSAIKLDPTNDSYYFNDGVALYRQEKMDEAMVYLRMAAEDAKTNLEKKYYMGLIHLRLKELAPAEKLFEEVGASKDPVLAPSAIYYRGVMLFSEEKYEEAKTSFEQVLDMSQDPKLDQQADTYIDQVAQALAYKKLAEQKWTLSGMVGLMYDSNVLLATDFQQAQGTGSAKGDVRLDTVGTLQYRPLFTQTQEFAVRGTANLLNSGNSAVSNADTWIYTFEAPWTYKTKLWGKGYSFTARPGFEMLYMALSPNSPKKDIMMSGYLALDNTFVMHENWFSTYTIQYRYDGSQLVKGVDIGDTTDGDNQTASQYYLKTAQTFLLDKSKQEAIVGTGGFVYNSALGQDKSYERFEIGAMFVHPFNAYLFNIGASYYYLTYPEAIPANSRQDNNFAITTGVSKPLKDWVTIGANATYTNNASTQTDIYQYQKYVIMTTATFNTGL